MAKTKIEWVEYTWNPLIGQHPNRWMCQTISPGCANCYASDLNRRLGGVAYPPAGSADEQGEHALALDAKVLEYPLDWQRGRTIFPCSMTDLFGEWVPVEWIETIFAIMALTPRHRYIVLTKRPSQMRRWLTETGDPLGMTREDYVREAAAHYVWKREHRYACWHRTQSEREEHMGRRNPTHLKHHVCMVWPGWPLPNVMLCTTIESDAYTWRARTLLDCPAVARGISAEPLLGPLPSLDFGPRVEYHVTPQRPREVAVDEALSEMALAAVRQFHKPKLDWLIIGGESGPKARPMEEAWVRDLLPRARGTGTHVFFKQAGRRLGKAWGCTDTKGGDWDAWPADLRVRERPPLLEVERGTLVRAGDL